MTEAERTELVVRVTRGDVDALQRLIIEYHDALLRIADDGLPPALRVRASPEDILQDAYVAAFGALRACAAGDVNRGAARDVPADQAGDRTPSFGTPAQFFAWLRAIVVRKLKDAVRAAGRAKRALGREAAPARPNSDPYTNLSARLSGSGTTPSKAMSRQESVARLMCCLARLTDAQRDVIRLRILEGVSAADTARRMGRSEDAVHALCYRALESLRAHLGAIA